jgi:DNA-binding XRE family transcriptional regulator
MGTFCGTSISRHERGSRMPSLEAAIAYECIFGDSVGDLFEGETLKIRMAVKERALKLRRSLKYRFKDRNRESKIRHLTHLLEGGKKKRRTH